MSLGRKGRLKVFSEHSEHVTTRSLTATDQIEVETNWFENFRNKSFQSWVGMGELREGKGGNHKNFEVDRIDSCRNDTLTEISNIKHLERRSSLAYYYHQDFDTPEVGQTSVSWHCSKSNRSRGQCCQRHVEGTYKRPLPSDVSSSRLHHAGGGFCLCPQLVPIRAQGTPMIGFTNSIG
ncbi:T Cell Receptor Gamma Variable 9 [Manis pentadactyla]|nr:T Cell Receptor Gamma Variable 9 [Manis pentadactyla]